MTQCFEVRETGGAWQVVTSGFRIVDQVPKSKPDAKAEAERICREWNGRTKPIEWIAEGGGR